MSKTVGVAFFGVGAPPAPPATPMDAYVTGMASAYGLKKVLGTYSGPILRVRRDSDNTEQDIGFNPTTGIISTTALAAFVGSANGFVTKWYDQNLTVDAVQATTTKQPKIVNAGTYLGHIQFDGVDDYLSSHTTAVVALSFAGFLHYPTPVTGTASASYFCHPLVGISGNAMTCQYQANDALTNSYLFTGNSAYRHEAAGYSAGYTSMVLVADRSISPAYYADGAARRSSTDTVGTPSNLAYTDQDLYLGSDGASQPAAIQYQEFIIWNVNQTANFFGIFAAL